MLTLSPEYVLFLEHRLVVPLLAMASIEAKLIGLSEAF
jgi:hypothetical protein